MKFKNDKNVSLALAVFLATDNYDHEEDTISATSLMKPTRMLVLEDRLEDEDMIEDVSGLVASRVGSAIHDAIERSWLDPVEALKALGHPKRVYENILVNPTDEDLAKNRKAIPVYMEQRAYKEVLGYKISGKFDFVGEGQVQDFKSTSVWGYIDQRSADAYRTQLSIYRWLNPKIITRPMGTIHYIFTDWSAGQCYSNKDYPSERVVSKTYELMGLEATDNYVRGKVQAYINCKDLPEPQLPKCTDEELWRKPTVWKYYKDPNKTSRSTKNFGSQSEATIRLVEDGNVGIIKKVPGQVVRCRYCKAFNLCKQKDELIASGHLKL